VGRRVRLVIRLRRNAQHHGGNSYPHSEVEVQSADQGARGRVRVCLHLTVVRWESPRFENLVEGTLSPRVKTPSNVSLVVGLGAVRITWIAAIVVCALAIITALVSGTNGRSHSPAFPGFAFSGGADQADAETFPELGSFRQAASHTAARGREAAKTAAKGNSPAFRKGRGLPTDKQASDKSRSGVRAPRVPSSQPDRTGERDPSTGGRNPSTPKAPSAPQAPSLPKPAAPQLPSANVPSPSLPQTESPSQTPQVSPKLTASVSTPAVQTPVANVPSVTVALP
jgi:hypothetical protein